MIHGMAKPTSLPDIDDSSADAEALAAAVAEARADPHGVSHEEVRAWLLRVAAGDFDAPPPKVRPL
jgi:DNA-binding IclR family transcriptional regulator